MFTGLVQDVAVLAAVREGAGGVRRCRFAPAAIAASDLALGESVAIDGCCLTVVARDDGAFEVDASPETLQRTTLRARRRGDRVNIERALRLGDRLGGHIVTGHVDATGEVRARTASGDGAVVEVGFPESLAAHFVAKGSVAVDGVSLTINEVGPASLRVFLIPHTLAVTTLGERSPGDLVNLETDLLGKHVLRALAVGGGPAATGVDEAFLRAHGWL